MAQCSTTSGVVSVSGIRGTNWMGAVPVVLSLAPTSLSSPTMPPPLHRMISRMTYLHVGLQDEVMQLYKFAPASVNYFQHRTRFQEHHHTPNDDDDEPTLEPSLQRKESIDDSNNSETKEARCCYPICWFEDEFTGMALRWHLFAGVLFDLSRRSSGCHDVSLLLPWKIRLHFTSYPTHSILSFHGGNGSNPPETTLHQENRQQLDGEISVLQTIQKMFTNSLKQALFLQYGSTKVAMNNLHKSNHERLWDSIVRSQWELYQEVNADLQATVVHEDANNETPSSSIHQIPVRLLIDNKPAIQRPCHIHHPSDNKNDDNDDDDCNERMITTTLGDILTDWAPGLFPMNEEPMLGTWKIQGIQVPLTTSIIDLWQCLCHPDHFLYIIVSSSKTTTR